MSGPFAAGLDSTPCFEDLMLPPSKRRRVTHADAEVVPKFRPEDNASNVSGWLHKIDQLSDIYGWDATEKQFVMQLRLRGSARRWYDNLEDYSLDWEGWKDALKTAFPRSIDYVDKLENMLSRNKQESETMTRYYHDKVSLLKRCNMGGEEAMSCIIKGLLVELRANAKAYQCQTPEQLYYGYLSSFENYKNEVSMPLRRSTWRRGATDGGTSTSTLQPSGVKRCYLCRKIGHEARDCRSLLHCDACRRTGHTSATCWSAASPVSTWREEQSSTAMKSQQVQYDLAKQK
ncbi:uncharacterized protein [Epargyreus clarus]|uniref:uncharacterized protein n=1 Tax=Epargyreus clarus TaxID=520877 RepID=UPI003C2E6496